MLRPVLVISALLVAAATGAAVAHTAVRSADPGPGETVSGVVDRVVLEFLDPVAAPPEIEVRAPDGQPVSGLAPTTLTRDDRVAERRFDPLEVAGRYRVDYVYVALDGAVQAGAHEFRYDPGEAGSAWPWRAVAVGAGALAALAVVVLVARRVGRAVGGDDHPGTRGSARGHPVLARLRGDHPSPRRTNEQERAHRTGREAGRRRQEDGG